MSQTKQSGFTIVELMIATAVFSVILLVVTSGIMSFSRSYMKGVYKTRTQETTRTAMADISQSLQFSKNFNSIAPVADGSWGVYCVDNTRFTYRLKTIYKVTDGNTHALIRSPMDGGSCAVDNAFDAATDVEMLGNNMQLYALDVSQSGNEYNITINVLYGDAIDENDLFDGDKCKSEAGSQFCATSRLTTTVKGRL